MKFKAYEEIIRKYLNIQTGHDLNLNDPKDIEQYFKTMQQLMRKEIQNERFLSNINNSDKTNK